MPRYQGIEPVTFQSSDGRRVQVKLIRPISFQEYAFTEKLPTKTLLDEVASRPNVFGDYGEEEAWRIFDLNAVTFVESGFDISKIPELKIPK